MLGTSDREMKRNNFDPQNREMQRTWLVRLYEAK